jgi:hypothetical protein
VNIKVLSKNPLVQLQFKIPMEFLDVQLGNGNVLINNNVLKLVIFVMDQKTQQVIIGDQTVMMDQMKYGVLLCLITKTKSLYCFIMCTSTIVYC